MIKVIASDFFGTIVRPDTVSYDEKRDYVRRFTAENYTRMSLPWSWTKIPAFEDSREGIKLLRSKFKFVTCSNWDFNTTNECLHNNDIEIDKIIELADIRLYKPKLACYAYICDVMKVTPQEVLFVTGNKGGPDNTGIPEKIGMRTILIRNGWPNNIIELAGELGC